MNAKDWVAGACALVCLTAPAAADDGVLAYSPKTGEVSSGSSSFFSLRQLQIKALEGCSADDCRIVMVFRAGECAAVASSNTSYGVAKGGSQAEAESAAMKNCNLLGVDKNCHVAGQHCAKE